MSTIRFGRGRSQVPGALGLLCVALAACEGTGPSGDAVKTDTGVTDTDSTGETDTDIVPPTVDGLCQVDVTCEGNIIDEPKVPCTMSIFDQQGDFVYAGPAGLELRGRSSLTFPKPQYSVELRDYTELPVWPGFTWKVEDSGDDLGSAWKDPAFDDGGWSAVAAPMGYGQNYLASELTPPAGGSSVTTYLRLEFTPANLASITNLDLGLMRNDGAVVYLNGVEVVRDNLPPISDATTPALTPTSFLDSILWRRFDVDPSLLVAGTNVLAVEIHQSALDDPDMRFDLYLEATGGDNAEDLLDMGKGADWILNGQYVDRVLWRNKFAFDTFQALGGVDRFATQTEFCEMHLNGEYQGVYTLGEKIEKDGSRLALAEAASPGDSFIVKLEDVYGFHPNAVGYGTWALEYPDDTPEAEAAVGDYLTRFEEAVTGPDPYDPVTGIWSLVDMDSAIDWVLLQEMMKNHDAYFLSVYMWKESGGKLHFTPWDLDLSMGYPYTDCGSTGWVPRTWADLQGQIHDIDFIEVMAADPDFHDALVDRWNELRAGPWSDETLLARIAGYDAQLEPAIGPNFARWPIDQIAFKTDYVDNWLCPVSSYDEEHQRTLDFLTGRLAWMDANINSF